MQALFRPCRTLQKGAWGNSFPRLDVFSHLWAECRAQPTRARRAYDRLSRVPETSIRVCGVPIVGRSIAGQESYYRLPTMRSALEIGRCPSSLVPVANVFVTGARLDRAAGIAS